MKILKRILLFIVLLVVLLFAFVAFRFGTDGNNPYDNDIATEKIPNFEKIQLDFIHEFNSEKSLPVTASALIDIDNDGVDLPKLSIGLQRQI